MADEIYGIVERNEHGRIVVRPTGVHGLLPGEMVEIKPIDEAPTPKPELPRVNPPGVYSVLTA